jgi:spoIIIJ-associated protein
VQQYVEAEGQTIEEALEHALEELGVNRDQVSVKVIRDPKKGILGLGKKEAQVRVTLKQDVASAPEVILSEILTRMGFDADVESRVLDGSMHLNINTDTPGLLIGRHGQTLNALEHLLNCILNKSSLVKKKVFVDTEGYRERREQMLVELAYRVATKVKQTHQEIILDPMPPQDRRIIHIALQSDDYVRTYSRGGGIMKRVVVTPRDGYDAGGDDYDSR